MYNACRVGLKVTKILRSALFLISYILKWHLDTLKVAFLDNTAVHAA